MKYLLKSKLKENTSVDFSVASKNELKMFKTLKKLIKHLFSNASFIEDYEIYVIYEFEPKDDGQISTDDDDPESLRFSTPNSSAIFT